ncbi:glyoxalase, partial [Sporolactobacillus sp. CPB3-1]|nr:glyoxalase [Sporolactobacillus mangiferae]
ISTGGYHHHLGLNVWNSQGIHVPEEPHIGLNYYRLVLPGENARIQVIKKLQKLGADIEQSGNHFFTKDPSGIKLELAIS